MPIYGNLAYTMMESITFDDIFDSFNINESFVIQEGFSLSGIKDKIKELFDKFVGFLKKLKVKIGEFITKHFNMIKDKIKKIKEKDKSFDEAIKNATDKMNDNLYGKDRDKIFVFEYKNYINLIPGVDLRKQGMFNNSTNGFMRNDFSKFETILELFKMDCERVEKYFKLDRDKDDIDKLKLDIKKKYVEYFKFKECSTFEDVRKAIDDAMNIDNVEVEPIKIYPKDRKDLFAGSVFSSDGKQVGFDLNVIDDIETKLYKNKSESDKAINGIIDEINKFKKEFDKRVDSDRIEKSKNKHDPNYNDNRSNSEKVKDYYDSDNEVKAKMKEKYTLHNIHKYDEFENFNYNNKKNLQWINTTYQIISTNIMCCKEALSINTKIYTDACKLVNLQVKEEYRYRKAFAKIKGINVYDGDDTSKYDTGDKSLKIGMKED